MTQNFDVIIIGGGIIGNSISAHLANENENLNIAVVNSTNLGMSASIASAGLLTPYQHSETENPILKDFCIKSFEYFPTFYKTIQSAVNTDLGFNQPGSLYLIFSNFEIAQIENEIKDLKSTIPNILFLNKQEIPKYEPHVTKETLGAYLYPNEGFINNIKFLKAISAYCTERKVTYLNNEVKEINITKNKIDSIVLENDETISAKKYALCNGVWANKILKKIFNTDENIIKAIKGEILQVETTHKLPLQKIIFCNEGYILPRPATNTFEKSSILIGSTSEEVNPEENNNTFQNSISGISFLTNLFQKVFPNYKNYPVMNHWAGLRPSTKDKLPILGGVSEVENLYFGLGHYRNGILMGPLSGKILASLILEKDHKYNIEPFKIDRLFKKQSEVNSYRQLATKH